MIGKEHKNVGTHITYIMKHLYTAALFLLCAAPASAQLEQTENVKKSLSVENKDTIAWIRSGVVQLGLNQGFLHNWAAGGEVVSLAVDGLLSGKYHSAVS